MSTSGDSHGGTPTPPLRTTVVLLLGIIGETTWRMFVPTIGGAILGVWADNTFGTKPWLTALGIVLGSLLAGLLIRKQLKS